MTKEAIINNLKSKFIEKGTDSFPLPSVKKARPEDPNVFGEGLITDAIIKMNILFEQVAAQHPNKGMISNKLAQKVKDAIVNRSVSVAHYARGAQGGNFITTQDRCLTADLKDVNDYIQTECLVVLEQNL